MEIRTDLALEAREKFEEDNVEIKGVVLTEEYVEESEIQITKIVIETENGARAMGRPKGTYITIECPNMTEDEEESQSQISRVLAKYIKSLFPKKDEEQSVLIVGLGNRDITPDALGPVVADNLLITRHVVKEYGKCATGKEKTNLISSIVPGVMAKTGMETVEIIKGIVKETKPDIIIAVDALAARSTKRLNRTIQIADTGINPGAGVGNNRHAINIESVGVPVIAIGIPTVVDAATIVCDTIKSMIDMKEDPTFRELLSPNLKGMFVTPKDVDETIKRLGFTVSEGINLALEL